MVTPAGSVISTPGNLASVMIWSAAALLMGVNLSSLGGGLMVQSGSATMLLPG